MVVCGFFRGGIGGEDSLLSPAYLQDYASKLYLKVKYQYKRTLHSFIHYPQLHIDNVKYHSGLHLVRKQIASWHLADAFIHMFLPYSYYSESPLGIT